jgi:transcriptional regulator with PAS, ATPase and Fis domain
MNQHHWIEQFDVAITVCDAEGIVLEMNDRAAKTFERQGGEQLVGQSLVDCHPEPARAKLLQMMEDRRKNVYTIEKGGTKKLIYQAPWYADGRYGGFVELSLEIPADVPHFVRDVQA